jgi:hypothetical protein
VKIVTSPLQRIWPLEFQISATGKNTGQICWREKKFRNAGTGAVHCRAGGGSVGYYSEKELQDGTPHQLDD